MCEYDAEIFRSSSHMVYIYICVFAACKEASEIFKVKCLEQAKQAEVKQNSKVYHKIKVS